MDNLIVFGFLVYLIVILVSSAIAKVGLTLLLLGGAFLFVLMLILLEETGKEQSSSTTTKPLAVNNALVSFLDAIIDYVEKPHYVFLDATIKGNTRATKEYLFGYLSRVKILKEITTKARNGIIANNMLSHFPECFSWPAFRNINNIFDRGFSMVPYFDRSSALKLWYIRSAILAKRCLVICSTLDDVVFVKKTFGLLCEWPPKDKTTKWANIANNGNLIDELDLLISKFNDTLSRLKGANMELTTIPRKLTSLEEEYGAKAQKISKARKEYIDKHQDLLSNTSLKGGVQTKRRLLGMLKEKRISLEIESIEQVALAIDYVSRYAEIVNKLVDFIESRFSASVEFKSHVYVFAECLKNQIVIKHIDNIVSAVYALIGDCEGKRGIPLSNFIQSKTSIVLDLHTALRLLATPIGLNLGATNYSMVLNKQQEFENAIDDRLVDSVEILKAMRNEIVKINRLILDMAEFPNSDAFVFKIRDDIIAISSTLEKQLILNTFSHDFIFRIKSLLLTKFSNMQNIDIKFFETYKYPSITSVDEDILLIKSHLETLREYYRIKNNIPEPLNDYEYNKKVRDLKYAAAQLPVTINKLTQDCIRLADKISSLCDSIISSGQLIYSPSVSVVLRESFISDINRKIQRDAPIIYDSVVDMSMLSSKSDALYNCKTTASNEKSLLDDCARELVDKIDNIILYYVAESVFIPLQDNSHQNRMDGMLEIGCQMSKFRFKSLNPYFNHSGFDPFLYAHHATYLSKDGVYTKVSIETLKKKNNLFRFRFLLQ